MRLLTCEVDYVILAQRLNCQRSEVIAMPTSQRRRLVRYCLALADLEYRKSIGDKSAE